jgi:hypothetical protein
MKHLLILIASMALFACSGGDSGAATEETVEEAADTVGADIAETMQGTMDEAAAVGEKMQEHKDAIDDAIEEAEDAVSE